MKILLGRYPASYLQRRYCSPSFRHVLLLPGAVLPSLSPLSRACYPGSFLFSSSSFRTSFRLLPRAQRLLTKLPLQRRSCRVIHVKPFKLEFIYATALRAARVLTPLLYSFPRGRTILNLHSRLEFILSIPLHDEIVHKVSLKSVIYV